MRLLVTGRQGQLARSLAALRTAETTVEAVGRLELDISRPAGIDEAIRRIRPDLVVNAAAYTAVDKAEDDEAQAFLVNESGARNVAAAAARSGLPVIHLSTDYVFSGDGTRPYVENHRCEPLNAYGRSKRAGELAVAEANPDHLILRTAWVFSEHGANFLKTMLRLAADRPSVRVVDDQLGTPTYAGDLAVAIVAAADRILAGRVASWRGTFHLVPRGQASWARFAAEIFRQSAARGGRSAEVVPITTPEYPTRAVRPRYSVLDPSLFEARFGFGLPAWPDATGRCLAALAPTPDR